jgi:hypothetical protein
LIWLCRWGGYFLLMYQECLRNSIEKGTLP